MRDKRLLLLLFVAVVLVSGCVQETTTSPVGEIQKQTTQSTEQPKLATKQPSELILDISDFTGNYSIKERSPRLKSDLDQDAITLGWKDGYYTQFIRIGNNLFDISGVQQWVSIYPIENISKALDLPKESNENSTYEELPSPAIGDKSKAWRITEKTESGTNRYYEIQFIKMNVMETFDMRGTATDYEALKALAVKAEAKIK